MKYEVEPASGPLVGSLRVPGDKSMSHRAVLFAAMAEGRSQLMGVLESADVLSTVEAVRALGADVEVVDRTRAGLTVGVVGWGAGGPRMPAHPVDCGNSGTTARLLMGVLAGWPIAVRLRGDASLSRRPMHRVTEPLSAMGARFVTAEDGTLPVTVTGGSLQPLTYDSPIASAQVKTAILLAGLRANGRTVVREPAPSRDHTERLLPAFGVPVGRDATSFSAWVDGPGLLTGTDLDVPGDPSSAAFLVAAGLLIRGSHVAIRGVSLNETRIGFLRVLERMGADVDLGTTVSSGNEPVGDVVARFTPNLVSTTVAAHEVPSLIDEVPILAVVATQARGTTRFEHVRELRVKESDRLEAIVGGINGLGGTARGGEDWLEIEGPSQLRGADLDSFGDHRLAMSWYVGGMISDGPVSVDRFDSVEVSYPSFLEDMASLTASDVEGH